MNRLSALALVVLFGGCRIATVRPLDSKGTAPAKAEAFNAATYVESIWASRVVPTVEREATDGAILVTAIQKDQGEAVRRFGRPARGRSYFLAKGGGRVVAVDQRSRNGLVGLDVVQDDGKVDLWVQVGPVVNGMALRDAIGFISFDQFVNQIDFADAGNALNQRVIDEVLRGVRLESLQGKVLWFEGALEPGDRLVVTPTRLSLKRD